MICTNQPGGGIAIAAAFTGNDTVMPWSPIGVYTCIINQIILADTEAQKTIPPPAYASKRNIVAFCQV